MAPKKINANAEVTKFLDDLNHPLRREIDELRQYILGANIELKESIKWNGPNFSLGDSDRITMRIQPPKQIQLIFHRGAKIQKQPANKLIKDDSGLLKWKENDRAIATFANLAEIKNSKSDLMKIVKDWIGATGG